MNIRGWANNLIFIYGSRWNAGQCVYGFKKKKEEKTTPPPDIRLYTKVLYFVPRQNRWEN